MSFDQRKRAGRDTSPFHPGLDTAGAAISARRMNRNWSSGSTVSVTQRFGVCGQKDVTQMKGHLTSCEAVASWIGRELGMKKRDLGAKFDVDPRRLYDVWQEDTHVGSRNRAERLFALLYPNKTPKFGFETHEPKFQRVSRDQLDLFLRP